MRPLSAYTVHRLRCRAHLSPERCRVSIQGESSMPKRPPRKAKKTGISAPIQLPDPHMIASLLAKFGGGPPENAIDAAQDIIYDAWDSSDKKRRIALAKKALEISPLCADAYVLLAQETARNLDEAIDIYRQGVEAGEKALGEGGFPQDVGTFLGLLG